MPATKRIITPEERLRRSEGAKRAKERLKADPVAYAKFCARTSEAVKKQWDLEDQAKRISNMSHSRRALAAAMTVEERRTKYGWMNSPDVSPAKKKSVWESSLKKWWDTAPEDRRQEVLDHRAKNIMRAREVFRKYDNNLSSDHPTNRWALKFKQVNDSSLAEEFEL